MHHDLVLAGPVLTLRPLEPSDAADLAAVSTDSPDVAATAAGTTARWVTPRTSRSPAPIGRVYAAGCVRE